MRGMTWDLNVYSPPADLNEKINQAADWTNQAFVIRLVATFESFGNAVDLKEVRLPNNCGMREFHHARRLRNAAAHGSPLTEARDISEETDLFRPGNAPGSQCYLAVNDVLEPMWARLLLYAKSLETGAGPLPANPAVVVVAHGNFFVTQSAAGKKELNLPDGDPRLMLNIGEVISVSE